MVKKQNKNETTRAAIYSRVSSDEQAGPDRTSLGEQVRACEDYCEERGYTIVERFQDVHSGLDRYRPGFRNLQAAAREGRVDVVVAWRDDRLSRSISGTADLIESTKRHDVEIHTIGGMPFDKRTAEIIAFFHTQEVVGIVERTQAGKRGAARAGRFPAHVPFGYQKDEDQYVHIDEAHAAVVRKIFRWYLDDHLSASAIAKRLKSQYPRDDDGRHGPPHSTSGVLRLLKANAYIGELRYADITVAIPAIIDDHTWERANRLIGRKNTWVNGKGNTRDEFILAKLLICKGCARLLTPKTATWKGLRYYRCLGYTPACRHHPYIRADKLERHVWEQVKSMARDPNFLFKVFESNHPYNVDDDTLVDAESEVQRWTAKHEKLISLHLDGLIDRKTFERRRRYIAEPMEAAVARLEQLREGRVEHLESERMAEWLTFFGYWLAQNIQALEMLDTDPEGQREVLTAAVDRIDVEHDNRLTFSLRLSGFAKLPDIVERRAGVVIAPSVDFVIASSGRTTPARRR